VHSLKHALKSLVIFEGKQLKGVLCLHDKLTNAIYKYVQSQITILHQHVSVTLVTIIRMAYKQEYKYTNKCTKMYDKTTSCYILVNVHWLVCHTSKKHLMYGPGTHTVQYRRIIIIIITTTTITHNFTLQWCTNRCVKFCVTVTHRHSFKQILAALIVIR
jgi:hypothetical protein